MTYEEWVTEISKGVSFEIDDSSRMKKWEAEMSFEDFEEEES